MAKKSMKLSSLFKNKRAAKLNPKQFFPSCAHLNTLSFRSDSHVFGNRIHRTLQSRSFSVDSDLFDCDSESLDKLIRGVLRSSERLFFEPKSNTSSMLEMAKATSSTGAVSKGPEIESQTEPKLKGKEKADREAEFCFSESSVLMAVDSDDPYEDFKSSMEEMIEFHRVRDCEGMEELLSWYLMVNDKKNHEFILRAFVDLFLQLHC